jgi:HSP20 family protein
MLTRWDPFRDLVSMRQTLDRLQAMDRLIENTLTDDRSVTSEWGLPLDVVEDENEYVVKASLPGVKSDDLEITYNKGMLTIKGEIKDESESTKGQYHLRERRYGTFSRSISLPSTVKAEDIQAEFKDGILALKLPKAEEVKPKRIPIQSGGDGSKMIDARSRK